MSDPIMCIDTSEVLEGKLDQVKTAITDMVAFVEENEPGVITYQVFLDERSTLMTVFQLHPDSSSMESHLEAARPVFAAFAGLIRLSTIEVYGEPTAHLLDQLRRKATMLGEATLTVNRLEAGTTQFG